MLIRAFLLFLACVFSIGTAQSAYAYDPRGNLTGDERGRSYAYDLYNRLTGAVVGGEETRVRSEFDSLDQILIGLTTRGRHGLAEARHRFERFGKAEYDSAGNLLRRYIPGGAVDQRVAMVEGASTVPAPSAFRYYHADRLGNVAALTDGNGRVTDRYAYDPFGNEITGAPTSGNPFRYTGRRYDPETGLYFYRARYYDAKLGRFLQVDPIGYADQWNLYTYVANDPVNAIDPDGRQAVTDDEREFVDQGDLDSFWNSRAERGDPIGDLGVQYGEEFGDRTLATQTSSLILSGKIFDKNDDSLVGQGLARIDLATADELSISPEAFDAMQQDWDKVRRGLAEAHVDAVDNDFSGTPQFLSADQITQYHHDVFKANGLPSNTFGGTPVFGGRWEAGVTNALTGWCRECDKD